MPIYIKQDAVKFRQLQGNQYTGNYYGVDTISDTTTEEKVAEINNAASSAINNINSTATTATSTITSTANSAISNINTAKNAAQEQADTLNANVQAIADAIEHAEGNGVDPTLTLPNVAAEAKATGDAIGELKSAIKIGYNNVNYILSTLQVRGHSAASDAFTINSKYVSSDRFTSDYDIGILVINDNYNVILHDCTNKTAIGGAAVGKFLPHGTTYVIAFTRKDNANITLDEVNSIAIMQPTLVVNDGALATRLDSRVSYYIYPNSSITDLPEGHDGSIAYMYVKPFANSNTLFFEQRFHALSSRKIWRRIVRYNSGAWNNWKLDGTSVESVLAGKNVSIYGDSISTFAGYIPEGNATYYTGSNAGVASVNDTWWKKTIDALGLSLLVNNSWSGRAVSSIRDSISAHTTDAGYKEANVLQLKSGTTLPDIIIVKLGINDFNSGAVLGDYDGSAALPTDPTKFLDAYAIMLNLIMTNFPLADVYCCDVCGLTYYNMSTYMGDYSSGSGLHPNAAGHSLIANQTIHDMDNTVRIRY